jgi:hypothetical protein
MNKNAVYITGKMIAITDPSWLVLFTEVTADYEKHTRHINSLHLQIAEFVSFKQQ